MRVILSHKENIRIFHNMPSIKVDIIKMMKEYMVRLYGGKKG